MITLKQFLDLSQYRITEGSDYYCNIPDLFCLSVWNGDHDGWSFSVVFSTKNNQRVYMVEVCDYKNNRAYRLKDKEIESNKQAWDEVDFIDLDVDEDFVAKANAIVAGEKYDTRVTIELDLDDDLLIQLCMLAHKQDITLNRLVENILWEMIRKHENDLA